MVHPEFFNRGERYTVCFKNGVVLTGVFDTMLIHDQKLHGVFCRDLDNRDKDVWCEPFYLMEAASVKRTKMQ